MKKYLAAMLPLALCICAGAQERNVIDIDLANVKYPVQKTMYGVFFEDINFGADGGLYAEKVKNRSFEFSQPLEGWKSFGKVEVKDDGPFENCPHYVRLSWSGHRIIPSGIENGGFFGMGFKEGEQYQLSFWARTTGKASTESVVFYLCEDSTQDNDQRFYSGKLDVTSEEWTKYSVRFTSPKTTAKGSLRIMLGPDAEGDYSDKSASVDLEHISLFPVDTFNGDENGLRKDVAQAIADLHPGVFRFPGGCIVEGTTLDNRYKWKDTVLPVENRPINYNRWIFDQRNRFFADYWQSCGLGFYEYFRFAEEIGAEALPVISCGMACQFENEPEDNPNVALKNLQPYIDDALDLIEFANGAASSKWGKVRAELGHPEPFNLHYIAIGNEQWGQEYIKRLKPFVKAIRAKYPEIKIVGTSGPYYGGELFDELWPEMKKIGADLVDEHFYANELFFENNADRYDSYDRSTKTKVFAGEYACHGMDGHKFNHFNAALVEAAFMTGLERNADVVNMATYAPLLAHVDGWQWRPDLIWFDNLDVMKTCSYYVQQLYSLNKGTDVIDVTMDGKPLAGKEGQNMLYASGVFDKDKGEYIVKIANLSNYGQRVKLNLKNLPSGKVLSSAEVTVLHSDDPMADNIFTPDAVTPQTSEVKLGMPGQAGHDETLPGRSFSVYKFKLR